MHWEQKAAIQRLLSGLPGGASANRLLQGLGRVLGRGGERPFLFQARLAAEHLVLSGRYLSRPASSLTAYEFGAGSDLTRPLTFYALGVPSQIVIDREFLLRSSWLREAMARIRRLAPELDLSRVPEIKLPRSRKRLTEHLRSTLGIDYRAPVDARRTGLPSGSIDLITSNSTLEHVPREDLGPLMKECGRLLRNDGVVCFRIDYEDHFAIRDDRISGYNFIRYSEAEWERFNSRLHFQNRLRHPDYNEIFTQNGFLTVHEDTLEPSPEALAELERSPIHDRFRDYSLAELAMRKGTFVLKKIDA
jgi:hypothetical protein